MISLIEGTRLRAAEEQRGLRRGEARRKRITRGASMTGRTTRTLQKRRRLRRRDGPDRERRESADPMSTEEAIETVEGEMTLGKRVTGNGRKRGRGGGAEARRWADRGTRVSRRDRKPQTGNRPSREAEVEACRTACRRLGRMRTQAKAGDASRCLPRMTSS